MLFKVIDVNTAKKVVTMLVMLSSRSMSICNCFHVRRANCRYR